jgi:hypothetical protein
VQARQLHAADRGGRASAVVACRASKAAGLAASMVDGTGVARGARGRPDVRHAWHDKPLAAKQTDGLFG